MRLERNPYAASQKQAEDDEDKDSKEKVADKASDKKKESSEFSEIVESDQPKPKKVKKPKEKKNAHPFKKQSGTLFLFFWVLFLCWRFRFSWYRP